MTLQYLTISLNEFAVSNHGFQWLCNINRNFQWPCNNWPYFPMTLKYVTTSFNDSPKLNRLLWGPVAVGSCRCGWFLPKSPERKWVPQFHCNCGLREPAGVEVTFDTSTQEQLGSSLCRFNSYLIEISSGFVQLLQDNGGRVLDYNTSAPFKVL